MPYGQSKKFVVSIAGSLLLCLGMLTGTNAVALTVDPDAKLPGISPAGWQSFTFNNGTSGFTNNIQSWYSNYLAVRRTGDTYTMYIHNEGSFEFWVDNDWDSPDSYLDGYSGTQSVMATFDLDGNLLSGTVTVTGAIPDLGIDSPITLMTADLIADGSVLGIAGFAFDGDLLGFSQKTNFCVTEMICTDSIESIYYTIDGNFPGFAALADGSLYRTTVATKSTVPIPASAWLMLSGLLLLGGRAKSKSV
jgi:hypothetical protein